MKKLLEKKEIRSNLSKVKYWTYENNKIKRELKFKSYMDSIAFINLVSKKAEQLEHHPNLIVGYCKIIIEFTSHELGGVTIDCFNMAKYINSISNESA